MKSHSATSSEVRGGRRKPPTVFTLKGVARLATILNTLAALAATDPIIDPFIIVQEHLARGQQPVAIPEPLRCCVDDHDRAAVQNLRKRLATAVNKLLDTLVDPE